MRSIHEEVRRSYEAAAELLEEGFRVIPLGSPTLPPPHYFCEGKTPEEIAAKWPKTPVCAWKEWQAKAPTEKQVYQWAMRFVGCNWGILTGFDVVVIDADSAETVEFMESRKMTTTPWKVLTGKGRHYYYQANPRIGVRNTVDSKNKIDVRGTGGYAVAPGSVHSSGAIYTWDRDKAIAQQLVDLPMLGEEDWVAINGFSAEKQMMDPSGGGGFFFDLSSIKLKASGEPVSEGGRNHAAASLAGQFIHHGWSLRDIKRQLDEWNKGNSPPLSANELNTTIASVVRTAISKSEGLVIAAEPPVTNVSNTHVGNTNIGNTHVSNKHHPEKQKHGHGKCAPFPEELYDVPGFLGRVITHTLRTARKPQPIYAINAALSLGGIVAGQRYQTATGLRLNNYFITCGPTASGKEHPRTVIKNMLKASGLVCRIGGEEIASGAGLVSAVRRSPSIIFQIDEFGLMLQAVSGKYSQPHHAQILSTLMKLHSAAQSVFTTAEYADQRANKMESIAHPCVTVHATTTGNTLFGALGSEHVLSGFLNRFLVVGTETPDVKSQRPAISSIDEETIEWCRLVRGAITEEGGLVGIMPESAKVIDNSDGAWAVFDEFEEYCDKRASETRDTGLDALYGRAWENSAKVAAVVALSTMEEKDIPLEVSVACAKWGVGYVKHCVNWLAAKCSAEMGESEFDILQKKVRNMITVTGADGIAKSKLLKQTHLKSKDLDEILKTLIESEVISVQVVPSARRPKTTFFDTEILQGPAGQGG